MVFLSCLSGPHEEFELFIPWWFWNRGTGGASTMTWMLGLSPGAIWGYYVDLVSQLSIQIFSVVSQLSIQIFSVVRHWTSGSTSTCHDALL